MQDQSTNIHSQSIGIVGGGMVGAVLALLLGRYLPAVTVTLFDRQAPEHNLRPSFDGRSTAIAPTTEQCFKDLGLWAALLPYVTPIQRIHVSDQGHAGLGLFDAHDNQGNPLGYVVENFGLGQVLLDALKAQANVHCLEADINSIAMVAGGCKLGWQTEQGSSEQVVNLGIIADGANSGLRAQLGIQSKRVDYQQHAIVANVRHELPHRYQAFERFTDRGPIALLPRGGNARSHESAVVWTCPSNEIDQYSHATTTELLSLLQAQFGFRLGHFTALSAPAFYPLELVVAQEQVRSNLVLMGNAAHFLHPVAGQGFNLSVRDSLRLVNVLKNALTHNANDDDKVGSLAILQRYLQQQKVDQRNTIALSHGFNRLFTRAPLPAQFLRTAGLIALELNPLLRSQFIQMLSGRAQPISA